MDELIKKFFERLPPSITLFLGLAAFLLVLSPQILNLIQSLKELRFGRKQAEIEKLSWEILRIRYDIEILKKDHQVSIPSELEDQARARAEDPRRHRSPAEQAKRALEADERPWAWLRWLGGMHPIIPSTLLNLGILSAGLLTLFSAALSFSFLADLNKPTTGTEQPTTVGLVIFMFVCTALLALTAWVLLRQRSRLKAPAAAPGA